MISRIFLSSIQLLPRCVNRSYSPSDSIDAFQMLGNVSIRICLFYSSYDPQDLDWTHNLLVISSRKMLRNCQDSHLPLRPLYTPLVFHCAKIHHHLENHHLHNNWMTLEFLKKVKCTQISYFPTKFSLALKWRFNKHGQTLEPGCLNSNHKFFMEIRRQDNEHSLEKKFFSQYLVICIHWIPRQNQHWF